MGLYKHGEYLLSRTIHSQIVAIFNYVLEKYMHAETLALLTKPLYFPNMKYLK
jgi:hypothetical protein